MALTSLKTRQPNKQIQSNQVESYLIVTTAIKLNPEHDDEITRLCLVTVPIPLITAWKKKRASPVGNKQTSPEQKKSLEEKKDGGMGETQGYPGLKAGESVEETEM